MIANFFNKTTPINIFFIGILFTIYFTLATFFVENPELSAKFISQKTVAFLFFLIIFTFINFIRRKNNLSGLTSYALLTFIILLGIFPQTFKITSIFIAHFFLLLSFRRIYSLKTHTNTKAKIFDSALWIGVATLIFNWSILFLLLEIVAMILFRKQSIRNFIVLVIGFLTPIFLVFTYCFFMDLMPYFNNLYAFKYAVILKKEALKLWVYLLGFGVFLSIAIVLVNSRINLLANSLKPFWILILFHLLTSSTIFIVTPLKESAVLLLFFPTAIIIANFIEVLTNKKAIEFLVAILILLPFSYYLL